MSFEEIETGLSSHISDLRQTLLRVILILIVGFVISLVFHQPLLNFFATVPKGSLAKEKIETERVINYGSKKVEYILPIHSTFSNSEKTTKIEHNFYIIEPGGYIEYSKRIENQKLILISPLEGLGVTLKLCFWITLGLTAPFWGLMVWQFISPGLKDSEKRFIYPFLLFSLVFVIIGILFGYYITVPIANQYLSNFNSELGLNLWSLSHYIDYTLVIMMGHAVAFELCLLLLLLAHYGFISANWMVAQRRYMIVLAFILGAILTPPDVLTQIMMAMPLIGIYEIAILYAKNRNYFTRT